MNQLTAIRTFARPGFCPVKRTRLFDSKWYRVRFQNTERDLGDGYYLADGEYEMLLPGRKAREARDARLNHCNGISEWLGDVWEVRTTTYGHMNRDAKYVGCEASADVVIADARAAHEAWIADVVRERERYAARLAESPSQTWREGSIADCDRIIAAGLSTFAAEVKRIR